MTITKSQIILILACLVTLGLTWQTYQSDQQQDTVLPTRVIADDQSTVANVNADSEHLALPSRALVPLKSDLFAMPKPPKRPKPKVRKTVYKAPPKVEVLPQLPFKYIGRWQDDEKQVVVIDYRGDMLAVKEGDVVASQYQVESIRETANLIQVEFLMMSKNKKQTLQARISQQ